MANPYFRTLSSGTNYPLIVREGEDSRVFPIGFPPEGALVRCAIAQVGGPDVGAQCRLYSRNPVVIGDDGSSTIPVDNIAQHEIVPATELVVTSGEPLVQYWAGYHYQNREGTWSDTVRRIYLVITPEDTSEATEWEVTLGVLRKELV